MLFKIKATHIIIVGAGLAATLFIFPFCLEQALRLSTVKYSPGNFMYILVYYGLGYLVYCMAAYRYNITTLKEIKRESLLSLGIQMAIDILIVPLAIVLSVLYNNCYNFSRYQDIGEVDL